MGFGKLSQNRTIMSIGIGIMSSLVAVAVLVGPYARAKQNSVLHVGKQVDDSYIVSTQQHIDGGAISVDARPVDMAYRPGGGYLAILLQHSVVLSTKEGIVHSSLAWLRHGAGFRGIAWNPDGNRLYVSVSDGYVQELSLQNDKLILEKSIRLKPMGDFSNPRPGGMTITRDGKRMFVALCDKNAVSEIDLTTRNRVREIAVQNLPFEIKLTDDEKSLVVTNWGGRKVTDEDEQGNTGNAVIVVDPRGAAMSGTVSIINRDTSAVTHLEVGIHPSAIAIAGHFAYVTNSGSDSISVIDIDTETVVRTMPLRYGRMNLFGSMPCAIAVKGGIGYICNGGDNAICQMDLNTGIVIGFRPVGFYPIAIALSRTGKAIVLNSKGNGSVRRTSRGKPGNAHDFQGTISSVDLLTDITADTNRVAAANGWNRTRDALNPKLKVYNGAIQHVIYIIKENRTYDEVLGDMPQGNGDANLCLLGERYTPNHHAIARQFSLFDNAYVVGTNSADGHQWCTQALANDYIEHFYSGYRTFPFDGNCAMAISNAGCLWDAALKRGKTIRDYGEFCDTKLAKFSQPQHSWMDLWNDRVKGTHAINIKSGTRLASLRPYINTKVLCWPLVQSDQDRADQFISDYTTLSKANKVPNLMILSLPCDHTEGLNPNYPTPGSMVADNDLALGRVLETVSKSPQWKSTCVFVIEDDAQFGVDHIDGHRTVYFAVSPYTKRGYVDHELCNTVSMIRSIEMMLGIPPMNRFDALTPPLYACFSDTPNLSPYTQVPNKVPLDQMNRRRDRLSNKEKSLMEQSISLDWSDMDRADPKVLNRIIWASIKGVNSKYPSQFEKSE